MFSNYELGDFIGQGAVGTVFKCTDTRLANGDGNTFAAKRIDLNKMKLSGNERRLRERLEREIGILNTLGEHVKYRVGH